MLILLRKNVILLLFQFLGFYRLFLSRLGILVYVKNLFKSCVFLVVVEAPKERSDMTPTLEEFRISSGQIKHAGKKVP